MASVPKILAAILSARADANTRFADLRRLLNYLGFDERIRGDHFIYTREGIVEIINLQPASAGKAKPYQVKQIRQIVLQYGLHLRSRP